MCSSRPIVPGKDGLTYKVKKKTTSNIIDAIEEDLLKEVLS
jgi:hypothetical protein